MAGEVQDQDLINAQIDCSTISQVVNGSSGNFVTSRLGQSIPTLASVIASSITQLRSNLNQALLSVVAYSNTLNNYEQQFTGDGATTVFTFTKPPLMLFLIRNGLVLSLNVDYSMTSTTSATFMIAPGQGDLICAKYLA